MPSDGRKMKTDKSKLLHQVDLSVSCVTEPDFINTSVSMMRFLYCSLIDHSSLKYFFFSEKVLSLSFSYSINSKLHEAIRYICPPGNRRTISTDSTKSWTVWQSVRGKIKHLFLFCSCETYKKLQVYTLFAPRTAHGWYKLASTTLVACY